MNRAKAKEFVVEIKKDYKFSIPLLTNYMTINPTEKLELPKKPEDMKEMNLTIPIQSSKILIDRKKETKEEEKPSLLNEITDISIVVDITLPITEYKQLQISRSEPTNTEKDNRTYEKAKQKGYKLITIEDFNIERKKVKNSREKKLFEWIEANNMYNLNEEGWKEFAQAMEEKIDEIENGATNNEEGLDKVWNRFINELRQIMKAKIPRMKISPRKFYAFSKIATKLHTAVKTINKVIRTIK
ncbi:hypothetical protein C2G38_2204372 [Gigaspora rosea]|uniref:Uncharacterized protein n=1 Tax=Gigaspora rosea TaxID=44941 RepID=A0A397UV48_9GLOM|nr:hypothetical protein C2G38_2204372 [Gigaspora rosea]